MFRLFLGFLRKRLRHRYSVLHPNAWNNGFMEMFWILQRGFTKFLVCELCFLQWLVIFNGCSVAQHMDPVCRFLTPSVNRTNCTSAEGFMKPDQRFHSHLQLCVFQMTRVIFCLVHAADGTRGWRCALHVRC